MVSYNWQITGVRMYNSIDLPNTTYSAVEIFNELIAHREPGMNYALGYFTNLSQEQYDTLKRLCVEHGFAFTLVYENYDN